MCMLCVAMPNVIDPTQRLNLTWADIIEIYACQRAAPTTGINPKDAIGKLKPNLADIPATALVQAAVVHALGHKKYGYYNWRTVPKVQLMVYTNAAMRHLASFIDGEDNDSESGVSHLAHVVACCNIVLDAFACQNLQDDRPPKAPTAELIQALTEVK